MVTLDTLLDILRHAVEEQAETQEIPWGRSGTIPGADRIFEIFDGKQKDLDLIKANSPYVLLGYFLAKCRHCVKEIESLTKDSAVASELDARGIKRVYMDAYRYPILDREFAVPLVIAFRNGKEVGELRGQGPNEQFLAFIETAFSDQDMRQV